MTRLWLTEKFCHDPNPHGPHKWPVPDLDEDSRFWCKGVENVQVRPGILNVQEWESRIPHGLRHHPVRTAEGIIVCTHCGAIKHTDPAYAAHLGLD